MKNLKLIALKKAELEKRELTKVKGGRPPCGCWCSSGKSLYRDMYPENRDNPSSYWTC